MLLAYQNSFSGQFLFDDIPNITENETVRSLGNAWRTVSYDTRPVTTLTLAANYALGGLDVWGYHAFNVAVHALAALALFGLVRRTLLLPRLNDRYGPSAGGLAFAVALLWAVHPLHTQSVTYVVQRAQSLTGLFAFLTLYALVRGATADRGRVGWYAAAVAACAAGMGCKQDMVVAPMLALLYDRIFLSGSWRELARRRWGLYAALAGTWLVLASSYWVAFGLNPAAAPAGTPAAPASAAGEKPTAGFALKRVTPRQYALTETGVILYYLRLAAFPHPQCLDYYDWPIAHDLGDVALPALAVLAILAATGAALAARPALGFLGAWFFLTLAPSSSVLPINDVANEHRLYLPLAALAALAVLAGEAALRALAARGRLAPASARRLGAVAVALAAAALGAQTVARNRYYADVSVMWLDVVAQHPTNYRALHIVATNYRGRGQFAEAADYVGRALQITDYAAAHALLGECLLNLGRVREAAHHFREVIRLADEDHPINIARPPVGEFHYFLARALEKLDDVPGAIEHYRESLRLTPAANPAAINLGRIYARQGDWDRAAALCRTAVAALPANRDAHNNLGLVLARLGRDDEAAAEFRRAVELDPDYANGFNNWGRLLDRQGRPAEALKAFTRAGRLTPNDPDILANAAHALAAQGHREEAAVLYKRAVELDPQWPKAAAEAAWKMATQPEERFRDPPEAVRLAEQAAAATGEQDAKALDALAAAYAAAGRYDEAAAVARKAVTRAEAGAPNRAGAIRERLSALRTADAVPGGEGFGRAGTVIVRVGRTGDGSSRRELLKCFVSGPPTGAA